jgi:hypothetical protein
MKYRMGACWVIATAVACSCSSPSAVAPTVAPLDPTQVHYGKTYAEWAAAWVEWVYQWPEGAPVNGGGLTAGEAGAASSDGGAGPPCPDPVADTTGALCAFDQDPNSPVFFLAGDWGGVARRPSCVAPAGKALFMPVYVGALEDNGGVPANMVKTDAELMASAATELQAVRQVLFSLDGHAVALQSYAVVVAPYQYTLPPEPNIFTCQASPGVTGTYSGYTSGYFVLLPPLAPGTHTITFSAEVDMTPTSPAFTLDVSYDPLTIR